MDRNDIYAANGNPYRIFTQFYNKASNLPIRKPIYKKYRNFISTSQKLKKFNLRNYKQIFLDKKFYQINDQLAIRGGRTGGIKILKNLGQFRKYGETRDMMSTDTTHLSPHNKFGTVSIREVYYAIKSAAKSSELCKQLYWRDFYYYVGVHFKGLYRHEHLTTKESNYQARWSFSSGHFKAWTNGLTGFPIVDAAMRELNETGFMHNRGRLIVSSFLVKDLLINWKYGERYFSHKLVDIDRAQNVGNWNWSSSFGLDSTPFLRILNPWTQSKEYDPNATYIKKWIPELWNVPADDIHNWYKSFHSYPQIVSISYPKPIVVHSAQRTKFIAFYKKYFKKSSSKKLKKLKKLLLSQKKKTQLLKKKKKSKVKKKSSRSRLVL